MHTTTKSPIELDGVIHVAKETRAELHNAIDLAADKAQPMADRLAISAHAGVDQVGATLDKVSTTLAQRSKQLGASCQQAADTGRGYVRTKPMLAVLMAMAAGYGLSKLMSGRK
ncbi:ElaB protein [Oxalobacteraceae bacterium GrIS 1.11]